jgi:hypothetical protein
MNFGGQDVKEHSAIRAMIALMLVLVLAAWGALWWLA